jgi:ABC-2 type transport system ATP-binding protein
VAGFDVVTDPDEVRLHIGLVFQEQTLDDQLTAEENLRFHAVLYRVPAQERERRIERVLGLVELSERRKDLVSTFSGGMARRLEIARAMLHTPMVLFLDEPTLGLDPQTRALMWEDVLTLRREEGVTVFLTTHYMEEAEVADRIAIIDHGRIVALDTPERLKAVIGEDSVELKTTDDAAARRSLEAAGCRVEEGAGGLVVRTANGEEQVARLIGLVGGGVTSVHVHRPTLEDVFLHFTGRQIRDQGGETVSGMARAWGARRR